MDQHLQEPHLVCHATYTEYENSRMISVVCSVIPTPPELSNTCFNATKTIILLFLWIAYIFDIDIFVY